MIQVTTKDYAQALGMSIVEVLPHIGRKNPVICIPKEISEHKRLQRKDFSDSEKSFLSENFSGGKLFLFPKEEKALRKIEEILRYQVKKRQVIFNYMSYEAYKELEEKYQELKDQYISARDVIAEKWEDSIMEFSRGLLLYLKGCGLAKADIPKIHKSLMAQLPSKKEWMDSFSFEIEVREYPMSPGVLPGLKEKWEERTQSVKEEITRTQICDLFEQGGEILQNFSEDKGATRKVDNLNKIAGQILNLRSITESEIISLAKDVVTISSNDSDESIASKVELMMARLVVLAKTYEVYLNFSGVPVDEEYLLELLDEAG